MNKITPIVFPPLKNKKNFQKIFYFNDIFKNLFKGVGLATLSFNRYNMPQGFLRRSCFKYNEKTTPSPTPTFKKTKHSKKFFYDIFTKKNSHTLSYDRESLVTSLLVFFIPLL